MILQPPILILGYKICFQSLHCQSFDCLANQQYQAFCFDFWGRESERYLYFLLVVGFPHQVLYRFHLQNTQLILAYE